MKSFSNHILLAFVFCVSVLLAVGRDDGTAVDPGVEQGGTETGEVGEEGEEEYTYEAEKALCVAQSAQNGGVCEACPCNHCIAELTACNGDEGCTELMECKKQTGCSGAECMELDVCGSLLDKYPGGTLSYASQLSYSFFECIRLACYDVCGG